MKKKILSLLLAAVVVLSMPTALFAAEIETPQGPQAISNDGGIVPMSISTGSVGTTRHSPTSGTVSAYGSFSKTVSKATCTITLQEKYNGSWRTATGIPVKSYVKTVYNKNYISAGRTFTLKSGTVYRAKAVFDDGSSMKTYYSGSF